MVTKLKRGDVFIVPTPDGRAGVGQVVATYGKDAYFFAIFESVVAIQDAPAQAQEALSSSVTFLALSLDAKIHAGHWKVVGNAPIDPATPLPAYKEVVGRPHDVDVVDYSGTRRRRATAGESESLPNRKVVAPVRLERALFALLGLEPWLDAFDELRVGGVTSAEIFGADSGRPVG